MALTKDTAIFEISAKGENTGKVYDGKFVMRLFLQLKERARVAVEYSKRDFGNERDTEMSRITQLICEYQALATESPEWFQGEKVWELQDYSPLLQVKEKFEEALTEYSAKLDK